MYKTDAKMNKEVKSDNFCYHRGGGPIIMQGAIEKRKVPYCDKILLSNPINHFKKVVMKGRGERGASKLIQRQNMKQAELAHLDITQLSWSIPLPPPALSHSLGVYRCIKCIAKFYMYLCMKPRFSVVYRKQIS